MHQLSSIRHQRSSRCGTEEHLAQGVEFYIAATRSVVRQGAEAKGYCDVLLHAGANRCRHCVALVLCW